MLSKTYNVTEQYLMVNNWTCITNIQLITVPSTMLTFISSEYSTTQSG
jgi:hypothetical protein